MPRIHPVIMCGGSGTRLWPVSRAGKPKQFQALTSKRTLFQDAVLRVSADTGPLDFGPPVIVGAAAFEALIIAQLAEVDVEPGAILLEPCPRNTAAVAALAALHIKAQHQPDDLVLLMPSDHHIAEPARFHAAVTRASQAASDGWLTAFGIAADSPETGYGYIQSGEPIHDGCNRISAFVEKPDQAKAEAYLADGNYSWNAGIFLFSPARMLTEFEQHAPQILAACATALDKAQQDDLTIQLDADAFADCPSISIDYAVMEKTEHAAVCGPVDCGWSDVGSWLALRDMAAGEDNKNVISIDGEDCYVRTDGETLVATLGVKDIIIVVHEGAVLVAHADRSQDIGKIVEELKNKGRDDKL